MVGKFVPTVNDKKKAKATCKVFIGFTAFFLVGAILSAVFTPRAKEVVGANNTEDQPIRAMTDGYEGEEFAIASTKDLQVYSMDDNKLLRSLDYTNQIVKAHSKDLVDSSVFADPTIHYEKTGDHEGYFLLFSDNGDIFKFHDSVSGLSLENTCWIADRVTLKGVTYSAKYKVRSLFVEGDTLYTLADLNNAFTLNKYDVNHLEDGILASKTFYSISAPSKDQQLKYGKNSYIIDPIDSQNGENPYEIVAEGDYIYILTSYGLTRCSKDFLDAKIEIKDPDDEFSTITKEISYLGDGERHFDAALREDLLSLPSSTLSELGVTAEQINHASHYVLSQMYKVAYDDNAFIAKQMACARAFKEENSSWVIEYDPTLRAESLVIAKTAADAKKNLAVTLGGTQTMGGTAYSPKNQRMYYLDLKSSAVYSLPLSSFKDFKVADSRTIADISTKTKCVYPGASFYNIKGNLSYDRNANTLHVIFYASRDISVIDLNGESPYIRSTLSFEYDIRSFKENKDGTKLAAIYQTEKRSFDNVATFPLHIGVITPSSYAHHTTFVVLFIVCIALCLVSGITLAISFRCYRHAASLLKMKVIGRDLKRNRLVYLALVPFVALLIMFCWIEAIGSISFSFFNYTLQKPSYIWNTFGNYIQIFNANNFWLMVGNTLFFLVFDLFLGIVPPIFFAFCLSIIKNKKLSGVLRAAMFIPSIVPGIATLLIWKVGIFGDTGVLNQIICLFQTGSTSSSGFTPVNFLHDEDISRWSLLLMGFPYVGGYLIFYGGIMNIPKEYDEACQLEGLGVVKRFFQIDLPLIKPQIKYIFVMGILNSVQNYERTYMLGSSGTTTLVESMYRQMKDVANPNYGLASAYATIIFLLLLVPVLLNFRTQKKNTLGDSL